MNIEDDGPIGRCADPVRPHAPRVFVGSGRRVSSGRRLPPCWRATGSSRDRRPRRRAGPALDSPLAPKAPHFPAKAKACIVLFMYGGVSQVDTFDPKPELTRYHGKPIPTLDSDPVLKGRNPGAAAGHRLASLAGMESRASRSPTFIPQFASVWTTSRRFASMYADSFAHGSGLLQMNTGFVRQGYPSLGSWVTYGLGTVNQNLPGYVVLLDHRGGPISGPPNWGSGFMPATYQGTQFRTSGDPILNLRPPGGISAAQQRNQLDLLATAEPFRAMPAADNAELIGPHRQLRAGLPDAGEAPEAVDLASESAETRRLYGLDDPRTERFGRRA